MVTILDEAEVPIARGVSGRLLAKVIRGGKTQVCGCDLAWIVANPEDPRRRGQLPVESQSDFHWPGLCAGTSTCATV